MSCNTTPKPMRRHPRGATWHGLQLICKDDNGQLINLTGVQQIDMHMREKKDTTTPPAQAWSTTDNTILIADAQAGKIIIAGRIINVRPFNYVVDVRIIMPNSDVVYLPERSWEIYSTVTR